MRDGVSPPAGLMNHAASRKSMGIGPSKTVAGRSSTDQDRIRIRIIVRLFLRRQIA